MPESETLPVVDLEGVEIAAADVTVFGGGSPEGGDTYSLDDLRQIAKDSNAVAGDLRPPVKLGHARDQRLLRASGLWGEQPRTGTLRNFRVVGDKLVCDVKEMPRKLADLAKSAFRVRSMELGPARSQRTQESYPRVVRGLALLGATTPAFQTLDDIRAMYNDSNDETPTAELLYADQAADFEGDADLIVAHYAVGDVIWDDEDGVRDIMDDVAEAINGPGDQPRYWVSDLQLIDVDGDGDVPGPRALVCEYGSGAAWVVPLTFDSEGEPVVPPSSEWTLAEKAWVQVAPDSDSQMSEHRVGSGAADTTRWMAKTKDTPKRPDLDEEQVKHFAELLGIEGEADAKKVYEALDARLEQPPAPEPPPPPPPPPVEPSADDAGTRTMSEDEFQTLKTMAERGAHAAESLRLKERSDLLVGAVKSGKLDPAQIKTYEERFDKDPEFVKQIVEDLPVNEELLRVYGGDGDGLDRDFSEMEEQVYRAYCANQGIPYIPAIRDGRAA